jgi:hypothetical protein
MGWRDAVGLYVQCFAGLPASSEPAAFSAALARCAANWAEACGIAALFYAGEPSDTGVWVCFYPPGDGIGFTIADGRVHFDAKTSIAGPGFHAALIDLCDALARGLGINWRWDVGGDETGYAISRNVAALRESFVDQFSALCEYIAAQTPPLGPRAVNLPDGLAFNTKDGVATPIGPLPVEFFTDALADRQHLIDKAAYFFPWWQPDPDQAFWENTLRATIWTEVEWRKAVTAWERHVHATVFAIDALIKPPPGGVIGNAIAELKQLTQSSHDYPLPRPGCPGWRRRERAFFLPGPWRINLPGYYISDDEDDGGTTLLQFGEDEIRGSSWVITVKPGTGITWPERFIASQEYTTKWGTRCAYRLVTAPELSDKWPGYASVTAEFRPDQEGDRQHLLMVTLFGPSPGILARFESIASGVWFNPPRAAPVAPHVS